MNPGATENVYDYSGLAAQMCAAINICGDELVAAVTQHEAPSKDELRTAIGAQHARLSLAVQECNEAVEQLVQRGEGWAPSQSLSIAMADAATFVRCLANFEGEYAAPTDTDLAFGNSLLELAVEIYTRDHALRVAQEILEPYTGDRRAPARRTGNVVQLSAARQRKPGTDDSGPRNA
jgi:hypothetical protein